MAKPEILTAVTTPFDTRGEVFVDAFTEQLTFLEDQVDGVFVAGTTGEFPALDHREFGALARASLSVFGSARTVLHVGAPSTKQALELVSIAVDCGVCRLAAITPYYLPATASGCATYYAALRQAAPKVDLYGYFFPEVAGTDVLPQDLPLLVSAGLDGIKVSGLAARRVIEYLAAAPAGFPLWSGNDADLPAVLAAGGRGTVSGVSGVIPACWADYRNAVECGDWQAQHLAQQQIQSVVPVLGPSIANLKYGLDITGRIGGSCRMAIDAPSQLTKDQIASVLAAAGAAVAVPTSKPVSATTGEMT